MGRYSGGRSLHKREAGRLKSGTGWKMRLCWLQMEERSWAKESKHLLEAGKVKERVSPLGPPEEHSLAGTLIFAPWDSLQTSDLQGCRRGWQRLRCFNSIIDSMDVNLDKLQERVRDREAGCAVVHGVTKSQRGLSTWTTTKNNKLVLRDQVCDNLLLQQ